MKRLLEKFVAVAAVFAVAVVACSRSSSEDRSDGVELEFVEIPAGEFVMGSPSGESGRFGAEGPQTRVKITKSFYLGKYEVTQSQWEAVMGSNPSHFKKGGAYPVENVSWADCQAFIAKLNAKYPGREYRLPTEAEWEYACRAGTTGARYGELDAIAWYGGNSGNSTHPVGRKQANAWGLHDMLGNVWEWCSDWYADELPGGTVTDPTGPSGGSNRVGRGGGWRVDARFCRAACRFRDGPGVRHANLGLRLASSSR